MLGMDVKSDPLSLPASAPIFGQPYYTSSQHSRQQIEYNYAGSFLMQSFNLLTLCACYVIIGYDIYACAVGSGVLPVSTPVAFECSNCTIMRVIGQQCGTVW